MWNPLKLIKKPFSWAWNKAKKKLAIMLIKRIIKELMKMEVLKQLWAFFSGKKLIIGLVLGNLVALLQLISPELGNPQWISTVIAILIWIVATFFAIGGTHKAAKKFDSK